MIVAVGNLHDTAVDQQKFVDSMNVVGYMIEIDYFGWHSPVFSVEKMVEQCCLLGTHRQMVRAGEQGPLVVHPSSH